MREHWYGTEMKLRKKHKIVDNKFDVAHLYNWIKVATIIERNNYS